MLATMHFEMYFHNHFFSLLKHTHALTESGRGRESETERHVENSTNFRYGG